MRELALILEVILSRILIPALLLLVGCFDFAGDHGLLGFSTDVVVDGVEAWTPSVPVAAGTVLSVDVTEVLATEAVPDSVSWRVGKSASVTPGEDDKAWVAGTRKGWVEATADGVTDFFRVRWTEADELRVGPFLDIGNDTRFAVRKGEWSHLAIGVRDRRARPLGYRWADVEWTLEDGEISEKEGLPVFRTETVTHLSVEVFGASQRVELVPVDNDEVELSVVKRSFDGECVLLAVGWAGELPVLDVGSVRWSHTDDDSPVAQCADGASMPTASRR